MKKKDYSAVIENLRVDVKKNQHNIKTRGRECSAVAVS